MKLEKIANKKEVPSITGLYEILTDTPRNNTDQNIIIHVVERASRISLATILTWI
jgi:hypothetical protein